MTSELKPDASGTVVLSGHEDLALGYDLKLTFLERLTAELDELKAQLRAAASGVLAQAGTDALRVFFRNGKKGGVSVSLPDFSKPGNRMALSDSKMSKVLKAGEMESLNLPAGSVIDEEVTEPGGEVIELRGRWVEWFRQHMAEYLSKPDPDIKYEKRDRVVTRRLKPETITNLRQLTAGGNEVAAMLLQLGVKSMTVKAER